jgi:hypothetical protein
LIATNAGRYIEERLVASLVADKTLKADKPLCIASVGLSEAFDKVNWKTLWAALRRQCASNHLVWFGHYKMFSLVKPVR